LLKSGFELVAAKGVEAIRARESDDAAAEDNVAKLRAVAKEFGAQIIITGTANANQAGIERPHNVPIAFYNCDAQVKVYYTDTGRMMASEGLPSTRGGARGTMQYSPQAGKKALANASQTMVDSLYAQVMERWATDLSAGGELMLDVEGMNFKKANDVKKLIAAMDGVENVHFELTKGIAHYRIRARMTGEEMAVKLSEGPFEELFEIQDLKLNRLQATAVTK
jgi:hypothetical protein